MRGSSPTTAFPGATALTVLPEDKSGQSFIRRQDYTLKLLTKCVHQNKPDIRVTGGEAGRIEAYFDANNRLQIVAPDGSVTVLR